MSLKVCHLVRNASHSDHDEAVLKGEVICSANVECHVDYVTDIVRDASKQTHCLSVNACMTRGMKAVRILGHSEQVAERDVERESFSRAVINNPRDSLVTDIINDCRSGFHRNTQSA